MITTPQEYVHSVTGPGRAWLEEFYTYMQERHPDIRPVMFRQRPMYKVGKSYVMFTAAKDHFSLHTLNFDLIEELKRQIPKSGNGKGSVNVRCTNEGAKPILKAMCDKIIALNQSDDPPPVDVTPELPYKEQLDKVFVLSKAAWRPLYGKLLERAQEALPPFHEYFPAIGILWKHTTTFAGFKPTKAAIRVEFYADRLHLERNPVKYLQTSANRVSHVVELTDEDGIDAMLGWLEEAYTLTKRK